MRLCALVLAVVLGFSLQPSVEANAANDSTYNPFVSEFLEICARIGTSGKPSDKAAALTLESLVSDLTIEVKTKDEAVFCSLIDTFKSNVSSTDDKQKAEFQPSWLADPSSIGASFDEWVDNSEVSANLQPNNDCLTNKDQLDVVTRLLYSRAVTVGDTKRVIVVEIKRILDSYLDPNRGYIDVLSAWSSNEPANCG